jgi:hypothetical protein
MLLDSSNITDAVERELDSFLANAWSAARVHEDRLRLRGLEPDARTAYLLQNVLTTIDGDCELLFAVMLLQKLGTELQLFAQPLKGANGQTSCFHVTRSVRGRTQSAGLPDIRDDVKKFVQGVCKDFDFEELCWGSDLPEANVAAVLNGTRTRLRDLSNVLRAAGYHLHLVLVHEEQRLVIGDEQFQTKFGSLYRKSFERLFLTRLFSRVGSEDEQPNSWKLLLGDLQ